ncbi:LOW QUALITY PROTEIN: synaptogyrin-2b [Menidia menidia]
MEEAGGSTAYGAALAGGGFDFHKFVRQPPTIVRLLSWVSPGGGFWSEGYLQEECVCVCVCSGFWTFLWFVCFCLLASQWGRTQDVRAIPQDAARAAIAFSFFSIATWGILTYFALGRFRRGVADVAMPTYTEPAPAPYPPTYPPPTPPPTSYPPTSYNPTPYTPTTYSYPSNPEPAFPSGLQPKGDDGYQPPSY